MKNKKLTSEEILKLSKEDFIKYMEISSENHYQNLTDLGDDNYRHYSHEEKINFWCENINMQMRQQVESGLDPYNIFKRDWYLAMKRLEPEFDIIIDQVFNNFKYFDWNWKKEEYLKRI